MSYNPHYFCVQDILATQERTLCKFLVETPKLGCKLNPSGEEDIKAGQVLELPMWLASPLSSGRQPVVSPELPRVYRKSYREILKADPCAVNLSKFGLYFYDLGAYAKDLDIQGDVGNILIHTFSTRFRKIMDLADNADPDPSILNSLDMMEQKLYLVGHSARQKLNAWLKESGVPMEAAQMVVNHKKRKRMDLEDFD